MCFISLVGILFLWYIRVAGSLGSTAVQWLRYELDKQRDCGSIRGRGRRSFAQNFRTKLEANPASSSKGAREFFPGSKAARTKLTAYPYLQARLRMRGGLPPLSHDGQGRLWCWTASHDTQRENHRLKCKRYETVKIRIPSNGDNVIFSRIASSSGTCTCATDLALCECADRWNVTGTLRTRVWQCCE